MVTLTKDCDVLQGFAPKPDAQQTYGYIRSLAIGNVVLPADIRPAPPDTDLVSRPGSLTAPQAVVGVLDSASG